MLIKPSGIKIYLNTETPEKYWLIFRWMRIYWCTKLVDHFCWILSDENWEAFYTMVQTKVGRSPLSKVKEYFLNSTRRMVNYFCDAVLNYDQQSCEHIWHNRLLLGWGRSDLCFWFSVGKGISHACCSKKSARYDVTTSEALTWPTCVFPFELRFGSPLC